MSLILSGQVANSKPIPDIDDEVLKQRIIELLNRPQVEKLVHRYFNPLRNEPFAGNLFHSLGENHPFRFTRDDLLSLNLLDEPVTARQVELVTSGKFDHFLHLLDPTNEITRLEGDLYSSATALWDALDEVPLFGPTRVSKLLARKRPNLLPIRDSVVNRVLDIDGCSWWRPLAQLMNEGSTSNRLKAMTPDSPHGRPTLLRVLDVAIWMYGSNAKAVRDIHAEFGLTQRVGKI